MTDVRPPPMTPADCDLTAFPFMPLYVARLKKSKSWIYARRKPAIGFYLINMWTAAWHEVPAGSLEDDDIVLMDAAECDERAWSRDRMNIMRGWVKCSDGRLYHPVVAELAIEAWDDRQGYRERLSKARAAKAQKQLQSNQSSKTEPIAQDLTPPMTASIIEPVIALKGKGEGKREGDKEDSVLNRTGADAPTIRDALWRDGVPIVEALIGKSNGQARAFLGGLLKRSHDDCARVYSALREAESLKPIDPAAWLTKAATPPAERGLLDDEPAEVSGSNPTGRRFTPMSGAL